MLLQHLKQAIRSLAKNKVFTAFNIIGFAIGFTVCVTIALYVYNETTVNDFIPNVENTYRLVNEDAESHNFDHEIAFKLKGQFPEIAAAIPLFYLVSESSDYLMINGKPMESHEIISTTNDFFPFMGIPILLSQQGNPFADKNSIILSRSSAIKLFGHYNIIGESVKMWGFDFSVSAIADDIPPNATFGTDVYVSDEIGVKYGVGKTSNEKGVFLSREIYFKVKEGTDINLLLQKINATFPENRMNTKQVSFQPVKSIYYSTPFEYEDVKTGNRKMLWLLIAIAGLTLFMSVFNYINYTISKQLKTLKETGIRITTGAGIRQILTYHLVEVTLSVILSFLIGVLITNLTLPITERLLDTPLNLAWLLKPRMAISLLLLLIAVILLSVWFPLSVISRSSITTLLGKSPKRISAGALSKIMTVMQLIITMVLLSGLLAINKQINYVKTASYGFNTEQLIRIEIPWGSYKKVGYSVLKEAFSQLHFVKTLSLTSHTPGSGWSMHSAKNIEGELFNVYTINIDADFLQTFGMKLVSGRTPVVTDLNRAMFISEATLNRLGWDDYKGKKFLNGLEVIGVFNDIQYHSMHSPIAPIAFFYSDSYYSALNVQLQLGNFIHQKEQMEQVWKKLGYEEPFELQFYNDYYQKLYQKEEREAQALTIFSIVAFVITCIGLLGQVIQTSERRVKEIGIRKINGATTRQVVLMLIQSFALWVGIAFVIATPIAYYAMSRWLENFAYKTALSWWIFALAGLLSLLVALLTVSWQSWRAATRNPVEALRYE